VIVRELTVVVNEDMTTNDIKAKIDSKIDQTHNRHYAYAGNRDVVYYVPEDRVDAVGAKLDKLKCVKNYGFGDPEDDEDDEDDEKDIGTDLK
jgi:hypothetical protein